MQRNNHKPIQSCKKSSHVQGVDSGTVNYEEDTEMRNLKSQMGHMGLRGARHEEVSVKKHMKKQELQDTHLPGNETSLVRLQIRKDKYVFLKFFWTLHLIL